MTIIKNYKMIAVDVDDLYHAREFTDVLELKKWIDSDENKDRNMDFVTKAEYRWLLSSSGKDENKKIEKSKKTKKILK